MGREWDGWESPASFQRWCLAWATECLRVLKPGGHMLAFGGTRTWHRLTCGIEDAGFEIRDSVADLTGIDGPGLLWAYGSGFPKSLDVSKAIDKHLGADREPGSPGRYASRRPRADVPAVSAYHDGVGSAASALVSEPATAAAAAAEGWGTALKPAWEPVVVARRPLAGTVARNVLEYGTGALNVDGCRVNPGSHVPGGGGLLGGAASRHEGWQREAHLTGEATAAHDAGRWPPNVLLGEMAAAEMDRQSSGTRAAKPSCTGNAGRAGEAGVYAGGAGLPRDYECVSRDDAGGASRFFPVFRYEAKAAAHERPRLEDGTAHPTVKPVDLMAWLVRLVTPPGGTVLDMFAGSGPVGEVCVIEGFRCVLIEKDPKSAELIKARLAKPIQPAMFGLEAS